MIHLDPWWNPAVEDQATDRAHRIGQSRPVTVYRLVSTGTLEEAILSLHAEKRALVSDVLEGTDAAAKVSTDELIALIRDGGFPVRAKPALAAAKASARVVAKPAPAAISVAATASPLPAPEVRADVGGIVARQGEFAAFLAAEQARGRFSPGTVATYLRIFRRISTVAAGLDPAARVGDLEDAYVVQLRAERFPWSDGPIVPIVLNHFQAFASR